jgi:hypothetical protein
VKLKYRTSATTAYSAAGANNIFIANTRAYDSHGAYNTSTGVITIPVSGSYSFKVHIAVTNASASTVSLGYRKNGLNVDRDIQMKPIETTFSQTHIMVTFEDTLNAGDTVDFNYQYWGGAASLTGDSTQNWVAMVRVGN